MPVSALAAMLRESVIFYAAIMVVIEQPTSPWRGAYQTGSMYNIRLKAGAF